MTKLSDKLNNKSKELLASKEIGKQIHGAIIKPWRLSLLLSALLMIALTLVIYAASFKCEISSNILAVSRGMLLLSSTFILILVISICHSLTNIFNLLREEKSITYSQISILGVIGIWIISVIFILQIQKDSTAYIVLIAIGSVLTWIFQDSVKGAVAFIHFRLHNLLKIGDWIQIPKLNVDGEIKRVTLSTITLSNWDTTISTIPTSCLQSEHFVNLQNMCDGKTYGRRLLQAFTIDTSWIHSLEKEEIASLKKNQHLMEYLLEEEVKEGVLNIHLFRLYVYYWLMAHPHVSQQPRLLVRWLEQKDSGMVLQVYAFLTECNISSFEWQQSSIVEHIVESMDWFGLRLYQSISAYDASNSNIYMADSPATYKKLKTHESKEETN